MTASQERPPHGVVDEFDAAAGSYDRLVGANPGYHRHLALSARRLRLPDDGRGLRLLDAGCGTGASTAALLRAAPRAHIVAVDGSAEMLARARRKPWPVTVEFVHARLDELTDAGITGPFDGILAAYLVRNLPDVEAGLATLLALLRPGAGLAVHEYSVRGRIPARLMWSAVCWSVIIPAGRVATGRADLYRYLWRSVLDFDSTAEFRQRMRAAGFTDVRSSRMTGWQRGIVHTFLGHRPVPAPGRAR
ncbi:ubiquinone/menaquinone biosynthesis C-methylase UbiE [Halopolyspora algeriensis]|uniref:Ubiquinone/menaquinone biosynthesis C-methylase UbiE n=1 Tax=Halopolyspora algeriensis TaxID=1500506 RepID=A0A368VXS9_9ACTN|nr:class I SAM-dependent methyltransferase [Halopolyspora algeriensis]RCW46170.1 ubiquinone/menaquinone biosynthesis C-methylase UbiE [Halopolyspora algeriensis]TQM55573.1 ubiquinone/menaquinone biosynthesis C-methylase UbiE [Halopolyspora algeriensis]